MNTDEAALPDPPEQERSGKMKLLGIKLKLVLSATFLLAGFIAWALVSLRLGHRFSLRTSPNGSSNDNSRESGNILPDVPDDVQEMLEGNTESKEHILIVGNCSIPFVPIKSKVWTETQHHYKPPKCSLSNSVNATFNDDDILEIANPEKYLSCCYREILRPHDSENDDYRKSKDCIPYTNRTKLSDYEYFLTECTTAVSQFQFASPSIQYSFHANVPLKPNVMNKVKHWQDFNEKPVAVAMIVLDSVSRIHAFRSLPRTLNLLLARMNFEDFKGHHILGEPTLPNALPLLLGASSASEFWKVSKTSWTSQWDKFNFIWKKFAASNYVTMFMEDDYRMATFNYGGQNGFQQSPTDYYPRPLFYAHREGTLSSMTGTDFCFGAQTVPEFVLDYHFNFLKTLAPTPTFSVNWMSRPQHDSMESLSTLDASLFNFFRKLTLQRTILENTVFIVTGDHGFWSNDYADTHEGLLERRLPLLLVRLPENLIKKHPEFRINIQNNAHRLTSHHDTYQTLVHLAQMASDKSKKRKKVLSSSDEFRHSLLEPIPVTRTCEDANIPAQLCACNLPLPEDNLEKKLPSQIQLPPVLPGALPFNK